MKLEVVKISDDYAGNRNRKIVLLASKIVRNKQGKQWLLMDEFGTHERHVSRLIEATAEKAASVNMTESSVDAEIASFLAFSVVSAQLALAVKGQAKPRKSRKRR